MLQKIREKSQGTFAWVILILICVPFALWGIQNYVGGGTETTVVSVGDKEFFQQDLNQAFSQYSQNVAGMNFDENTIKSQALEKLIRDEVLFQYVLGESLVVTDQTAKKYIQGLEYFHTDGKFDKKQYKALLGSQRISSTEFVNRIKKALVMEQFQRSVTESSFVTQTDIDNFFRIQNQTRDVEIIAIALQKVEEEPSREELESYYHEHQSSYLTEEQVSIEYVELSLDELAKQVEPTEEELIAFFDEQKDLYTTKERRKISHILFAFTENSDEDDKQLAKAISAKQSLKTKDFSVVAAELSDDKITAAKGGDLGLFNVGVMEADFEAVASSLQLNEVSDPVKSAFGYHLIKVTELEDEKNKSFDEIKDELTNAYQRSKAENNFYEFGEILTEVSYENPESLQAAADALSVEIKQTSFFGKNINLTDSAENPIYANKAVINAAFSEDVLKGNNSEPIELGSDSLIVLRMLEYKPAEAKQLNAVKDRIITTLLNEKSIKITQEKAEKVNNAIANGEATSAVAERHGLEVQRFSSLTRASGDLNWQVNQAVFKLAKPLSGEPTVDTFVEPTGAQTVIKLLSVTEGVMTESDKAKQKLAEKNMARAFGQAEFTATLLSLRADATIKINIAEQQ